MFREIELPNDYYWEIIGKVVRNPYQEPMADDIGIGQLTDDWQSCFKECFADRFSLRRTYFIALASILKAIGEYWTDAYINSLSSN